MIENLKIGRNYRLTHSFLEAVVAMTLLGLMAELMSDVDLKWLVVYLVATLFFVARSVLNALEALSLDDRISAIERGSREDK